MNRTAIECEWLREFAPVIDRPDRPNSPVCWDWLPGDWTKEEDFYRYDRWTEVAAMKSGHVKEEYDWVCKSLDDLLASYGYMRDGHLYRAEQPNTDTIVFFCHFGLGCVLISHLSRCLPDGTLAWSVRGANFGCHARHGRTQKRSCKLPDGELRRYLPSLCEGSSRLPFLRGSVSVMIIKRSGMTDFPGLLADCLTRLK